MGLVLGRGLLFSWSGLLSMGGLFTNFVGMSSSLWGFLWGRRRRVIPAVMRSEVARQTDITLKSLLRRNLSISM
ncbi:MAG: hypothetical protein DRN95_06440 [Candidatus Hydrothermarchaeota archaeon]|nr:MAG: hypothetical protein DRN95_06440 [Candidatus Hydrothermarchaeota archaeon]